MVQVTAQFRELASTYAQMAIEFPHLRAVTLAQWMLETGMGSSKLFLEHRNAGGIKWRDEMAPFGIPFSYEAHDGRTNYVEFNSYQDFVKGYWRFIDRAPYAGWRDHVATDADYIMFLKACGYAEDPGYVGKVRALIPEAKALLLEVEGSVPAGGEVTWFKRNRNDKGETVIVAMAASNEPKAICTSDEIRVQRAFEDQYPKAKTSKVAPAGETVLPGLPEYTRGETPKPEPKPEPMGDERPTIDISDKDSPNCSTRGATITHIVLHNTAGTFDSAVSWLCNPAARASAHLVVSRQGKTACLVPFSMAAWHAGNSRINHCSVGIEIEDVSSDQGMPEAQNAKVVAWVRWLMKRYNVPVENVGIHRWYSETDCPILVWRTDEAFKAWRKANFGA